MSNRVDISKVDVIVLQVFSWILTGISIFIIIILFLFDISINTIIVAFCFFIFNFFIQNWNTKIYNIWYENGYLYFKNIYETKITSIDDFQKISMTSLFNNNYTLYLKNGEKYNFRIKPSEDLESLFKSDSQFYAKLLSKRIESIINADEM
jgi:hypothetical protein